MKILNLIRERLTARHTDARTTYWTTIEKIGSGELSERAAASAADSIEKLLPSLNKSLDDVERDIADVTTLREAAADAQRHESDHAALKAVLRAGVEVEQRAVELEVQARELRQQQAARVELARGALAGTDGAESRLHELHRRLAAAGRPESMHAGVVADHARQIEELEVAKRQIDSELIDAEIAARQEPSERRTARVTHLREERDRLAEALADLRDDEHDDAESAGAKAVLP